METTCDGILKDRHDMPILDSPVASPLPPNNVSRPRNLRRVICVRCVGESEMEMPKVDSRCKDGTTIAGEEDAVKGIRKKEDGSKSTSKPFLRVKRLSVNAVLPSRASPLAAGYDLFSACTCVVAGRGKARVETGLSIAVPEGTYGRIAPRSGLAWMHSIDVGAGVIDADYRGPVDVILYNHSKHEFKIKPGDRIAQLIIEKIVTPNVLEVDDLDSTIRGGGGFGSTGV